MILLAIFVLLNLWTVSVQQTCTYHEGPTGTINSPAVYEYVSGVMYYGCWYTGPQFATCNGTCESYKTLPKPYDLGSLVENCDCCEASVVIEWAPIFYCSATLTKDGTVVWEDTFRGVYYTFDNCECDSGTSRKKRQTHQTGQLFFMDGKLCQTVKYTVFTSKCNTDGEVTICRSDKRLVLAQEQQQKYWKRIYNDIQRRNAKDIYLPDSPYDIVVEDYRPRDKWILPQSIFLNSTQHRA